MAGDDPPPKRRSLRVEGSEEARQRLAVKLKPSDETIGCSARIARSFERGQARELERYEKDRRRWEAIAEKRSSAEKKELRRRRDQSRRDADAAARHIVEVLEERRRTAPAKRGAKETPVPKVVKQKVAKLCIDGETVAEIMRQTKLTKTVATRLARQVDEVLGQLRAGRY